MIIRKSIESVSGPIAHRDVQQKIMALEAEWKQYPQIDIPVIHRYSGGIYAREITIPKDTLLTGRIYKDDHMDVMLSGDITASGDDGIKRLTGLNIFPGKKGKKRAGYAHEDTQWITFHKCPQMNDDEYLDYLTVESFEDLDRHDYKQVLLEYGFTEEVARGQSENESDRINGMYQGVELRESKIEGQGLFSTRSFKAGADIIPARLNGLRTIGGRYVNHALNPNAVMVMEGDDIYLVALTDIENEEITVNYRASLGLQIRKVA